MIRVKEVVFGYNGGEPVLNGIDLDIGKGDMIGILGPNGSGKSTLIGIMCGTLRPGRGVVLLEGKDIRYLGRKEIARKIAVVPQKSDLGFDYRVEEVVSMGRYPYIGRFSFRDPDGKASVEDAMELTGTADLRDKTVDRLSGGERQRVMIARALAQEPRILMLDEPTKNLDIRHSLDIMKLLKRWNRERELTMIAVLHDLDLAARSCSRAAMLKNGRIRSIGSISKVLTPEIISDVFDVEVSIREVAGSKKVDILR